MFFCLFSLTSIKQRAFNYLVGIRSCNFIKLYLTRVLIGRRSSQKIRTRKKLQLWQPWIDGCSTNTFIRSNIVSMELIKVSQWFLRHAEQNGIKLIAVSLLTLGIFSQKSRICINRGFDRFRFANERIKKMTSQNLPPHFSAYLPFFIRTGR